jgi:hypothetical protein
MELGGRWRHGAADLRINNRFRLWFFGVPMVPIGSKISHFSLGFHSGSRQIPPPKSIGSLEKAGVTDTIATVPCCSVRRKTGSY